MQKKAFRETLTLYLSLFMEWEQKKLNVFDGENGEQQRRHNNNSNNNNQGKK